MIIRRETEEGEGVEEEIEEIEARAAIITTIGIVALPGTTRITIKTIAPLGIIAIRTVALNGIRIIRAAVSRRLSSTRPEVHRHIGVGLQGHK